MRNRSKKQKTEADVEEHDNEIWFRAASKTVAASLSNDYAREMLSVYFDYMCERPIKERRALRDRLINELHCACDNRSATAAEFKCRAVLAVQEFLETLEFLRTRVGPSDGILGRKLHGGDLDEKPFREELLEKLNSNRISKQDRRFYQLLLDLDSAPKEVQEEIFNSEAFQNLLSAMKSAVAKQDVGKLDWPEIIDT